MTFREELEILRGSPIRDRLPVEKVPCQETSDSARLCRHPLVSVHMVTYNHEPYIRQAIESVLAQVTDFEYEIVIGEDCSKDRTREICFEYQRKYPDKIRVLWSEENVFRVGGNAARVSARCRGEYVAILEGDDCWIDPYKLQKQVKVMRANPSVGICIGHGICHNVTTGENFNWQGDVLFPTGFIKGDIFRDRLLFESSRVKRGLSVLTASVMLRRSALEEAHRSFEIFNWNLITLDTLCWAGVSSVSDAYCLEDSVAQYDIVPGSASSNSAFNLEGDSAVIKVFFAHELVRRTWSRMPIVFRTQFMIELIKKARVLSSREQKALLARLVENPEMTRFLRKPENWLTLLAVRLGVVTGPVSRVLIRVHCRCLRCCVSK